MNASRVARNQWFGTVLVVAVLLSGCGSSGNADPVGLVADSITVSDLTGTDVGSVGQTFNMEVAVVVTGNIPANQITYGWAQSAGFPVTAMQQVDGTYRSSLTFIPVASGIVTMTVTTTTGSGKVSVKSKTVTVNP